MTSRGADRITTGDEAQLGRRPSRWPLVAVCVGYFTVILDTMVVNVALPALSRSLHATTSGLEWVVDAYSLVFAALLLSGGALGDRRGAKSVFQAGMGLFALASGMLNTSRQLGGIIGDWRRAWRGGRHRGGRSGRLAAVCPPVGTGVSPPAGLEPGTGSRTRGARRDPAGCFGTATRRRIAATSKPGTLGHRLARGSQQP
ncbi:MAG: MFS transporter [Acidimicrobiales bacterium]